MKVLTIIIPAYNAEPYIDELMERLRPQIAPDVEVLIIDDGSEKPYKTPYEWATVYRQKNKGLSNARNKGLDKATGKYIAFIDADDMVAEDFIQYIRSRADEPWDYMDLSWRSLEDKRFNYKLKNDQDKLSNPSVCTRVWRRDFIGNIRFNEKKDAAEDEDFTRRMNLANAHRICATNYMYYYRVTTPDSLSKKYRTGRTKTKRIVYYFPVITANDFFLLEEVKETSETNEVVIMTNRNDLPELEKYALITKPKGTWADEARGIKSNYVKVKEKPMETQVALYISHAYNIGGIESFLFNFCTYMAKYYDIAVIYDQMSGTQIKRLQKLVPVIKNNKDLRVKCDTLIVNRVFDKIPGNIEAKQIIQMVHGCKAANPWHIPQDRGQVVTVSKAVKDSFGDETADATIIKNLVTKPDTKPGLLLITASRLDTPEKGQQKMRELAAQMKTQGVPFIWLVFSNEPLKDAPPEIINMQPRLDIADYIRMADYLVQLSDTEAFCYSIVEALIVGTPVITTPLPILEEIGVKDGKNAHIIEDPKTYDTTQLLDIPEFAYNYNNSTQITKWRKILGNTKPKGNYKPPTTVTVRIIKAYKDIELDQYMRPGDEAEMTPERAEKVEGAGFGIIQEG